MSVNIIEVPYNNIDLDALENLKGQVEGFFKRHEFNIIIDMASVSYLSSTGLGLLVYINNKCNENGGNFAVCGLQDYTNEMIKLTKLDSVLNIYKNQEESIAAFENF